METMVNGLFEVIRLWISMQLLEEEAEPDVRDGI